MSPAQCGEFVAAYKAISNRKTTAGIEDALSEALLAALLSDGAAEIAKHVARKLLGVAWPHLPLTSEQLNTLVTRLLPLLDEGKVYFRRRERQDVITDLRAKLLHYTVNHLIRDGNALANVEKCYRPLMNAVQPMDE